MTAFGLCEGGSSGPGGMGRFARQTSTAQKVQPRRGKPLKCLGTPFTTCGGNEFSPKIRRSPPQAGR